LVVAACPPLHQISDRTFKIGPVSLELTAPCILAVVGAVSSGKSVLMRALAGECALASGALSIHSRASYSSQEPFLYDASVLDNIVFGMMMNVKILNEVTAACGLDRDAKSWPGGLSHSVGPAGRRCSSGQRMRISVARALYRSKMSPNGSVCIMDGPSTGLDDALVHTVLESLAKHALQGSIVCISFASEQHLKILIDRCSCRVTVISLQQNTPPQVLPASAYTDLASVTAVAPSHAVAQSVEQRDSDTKHEDALAEEHREFGG
jgi:ABC-type transport system involved in cytochrome bd biosynthesis fused ATPase/permease subunit